MKSHVVCCMRMKAHTLCVFSAVDPLKHERCLFLKEFKLRTGRGQAEEGCQRGSSSAAFQMFCKGCEIILLKSKTILTQSNPSVNKIPLSIGKKHTHTYADKQIISLHRVSYFQRDNMPQYIGVFSCT